MDPFSSHLIPPTFSPPDDLSFADCVLYPPSEADLAVYDRTSNLRRQLSKFEDSANGSYFPSSYPSSGPTSVYSGGNGGNPYIDTNETFSEPISDKFVSCFTEASTLKPPTAHGRTGSSVSGGGYTHSDAFASPWTAHLSTPGLGSPSSSSNLDHLGCYMSPQAYTSDEFMIHPGDQCMYPSPADLASVALPEVQLLPDQQPVDEDIQVEDQALPLLLDDPNQRRVPPITPVDDVSIRQELARSPKRSPPTQRKSTTDRVHKPKSRASAVHHQQRQSQVGSQSRKGSGPSSTSPKTTGKAAAGGASNATRPRQFKCSFADYGCESVFSAKNEWKRHVGSQHLQLGFYRCDVDKCNVDHQSPNQHNRPHHKKNRSNHTHGDDTTSPAANDFNRKDLFTSHLRRMHAPWGAQSRASDTRTPSHRERETFERSLDGIRERCWQQQRQPPLRSQCGICGQTFSGEHSWDERMEHVGRHYERDEAQPEQEMEDAFLREWAIEQKVILPVEGGGWLLESLFE